MASVPQIIVNMAEIQYAQGPAVFSCLGLGSCIGLVVFDRGLEVSGMIHIMLPEAFKDRPVDKLGKFADTGIEELLRGMQERGADRRRMVAAYAGGAQVFKFGSAGEGRLDVGARNVAAVASLVKSLGLRVLATDVGGSSGRTVTVDIAAGSVSVRTLNEGTKILCNLRSERAQVAA